MSRIYLRKPLWSVKMKNPLLLKNIFIKVHLNLWNMNNIELNNNAAHRTHNNTVSLFIPLQSDSQTLTKLDEKTSKENSRSQYFYDSSSSSLLSTHVLITLFGSPSPNLVVLLNVTKLWGVGLVKLSYNMSTRAIHCFLCRKVWEMYVSLIWA